MQTRLALKSTYIKAGRLSLIGAKLRPSDGKVLEGVYTCIEVGRVADRCL